MGANLWALVRWWSVGVVVVWQGWQCGDGMSVAVGWCGGGAAVVVVVKEPPPPFLSPISYTSCDLWSLVKNSASASASAYDMPSIKP